MDCAARGKVGKGNITIHSRKERRYKCTTCGRTFSETTVQAIVKAFGLDDETVRDWMKKAGLHCEQVHEHFMETTELDLEHVQADEIKVKKQRGWVWMGPAMMVKTRLWLGGVVGPKRDKELVRHLAGQVREWALCRQILAASTTSVPLTRASAFPSIFPEAASTGSNAPRPSPPV